MRTLPQLIRDSLKEPRENVLSERVDGAWRGTSRDELVDRIESVACAIRDAGLDAGDRVALIGADSVNWIVADFGTLLAACVVVPIFPTQAGDQVAYILENSQAKLIFADTQAAAQRLRTLNVPLPPIVVFESTGQDGFAAFESHGREIKNANPALPASYESAIEPNAMAILIYTSGTTGEPKGVMLSHNNLVSDVEATFAQAFGSLETGVRTLSVLPFSHIYEHCVIYGYLFSCVQHFISHSVDHLLADLQDVHPVIMTAVPRIFERVIAGIIAKAKIHGGLQAKLVPWALGVGRDYMSAKVRKQRVAPGLALQYKLAHALVLRKLRPALGLNDLHYFASGSAPLHFDTAMTMLGADIPIVEGYGPTECSPVITANKFETNRYGTVGRPIPGVEIKIAEDGEVLARGPNVMLGYYKNQAATDEVLKDGWYHTGDVGEIDADGYLRITDRKKELFKTSGGKFVAPARVEAAIKRSVYVNQVMLAGDSRPYPVALVCPNWDLLRTEFSIPKDVPIAQIAVRPDIVAFLTAQVREHTADLAKFEQVRKIAVLARELSVEDGDLSPTLKLRRRVVEKKYMHEIDALYAQPAPAAAG
ncbi:MAG TPA: long-chain fatty acid--CoA ligase [Candidatus Baltobacteraceae bacterium]|nr:long-chain fatty acid--CoA ligase [Candidatus Baltobacteraceae bacterium]